MAELQALQTQVLLLAFGLALAFGALAQGSHFCAMGAVADYLNFGDTQRLRQWLLAVAVAALGFNTLVATGLVQAQHSFYTSPKLPWLSNLLGGVLFGVGMVLASGCGSKTLVRVGGGSLKALVVAAVMAIAAYASLRGVVAVVRVATVDQVVLHMATGQDLPSVLAQASKSWGLGWDVRHWAHALSVALMLLAVAVAWLNPQRKEASLWWGGLGLGTVVAAVWWVSGVLGHVAEHPTTLEETWLATNSRRMESLSFVAPVAYSLDWLILFSDASKTLSIGIVSVLGVVLGSAVVALATGRFRWEGFANVEDVANHLVGAVLMGVGGVAALGCTVGQGLSGLSTLSLGSFIAVAGIFGGAALGLRWQRWRVERGL